MPTTNQLILGAQQRLPKKRMRDKKTPALQGSPQTVSYTHLTLPTILLV